MDLTIENKINEIISLLKSVYNIDSIKEEKICLVLNKLYLHQLESFYNTINKNKGVVILPTGTGKTFLQSTILIIDIIINDGFRMYVVNAPRIMLSYQLMKEVYEFFGKFNIESRYMCVHSGTGIDIEDLEDIRKDTNIPYSEINSTTSSVEICEMIDKAKNQNLPLIFFSTYNSFPRIEDARKYFKNKIDIILNDEAHYLVQNEFHKNLGTVKHNRQLFFTATTRVTSSDDGQGMNNTEKYGDVLYQMIPREAIDRGFMVRPRIHIVTTENVFHSEDLENNIGYVINEVYKQHSYILDGVLPKMLVSVSGTDNMVKFRSSREYQKLINLGVNIYMVSSSDTILNSINGKFYSRLDFLNILKEDGKDPQKRMIVLHYDILSEGIDVSGFTGVMVLRSLKKSKFLQTYGRIARLYITDKEMIASGKLLPNDLDNFIKPYGWIIIPNIVSEDEDNKTYISELISELRDYGFDPKEDIKVTEAKPKGIKELEGPEALNFIQKNMPKTMQDIQKLEADYEDERIARLTIEEFLDEI